MYSYSGIGSIERTLKVIPSSKTWLKHAYLHLSIVVKFIFDSSRLGLFSSANILQTEDVALRVVFLLLCYDFSHYFA